MNVDVNELVQGDCVTLVCEGIIRPRHEFIGLTPNGVVVTRNHKTGSVVKTRLAVVVGITKHHDDRFTGERPGMRVRRDK